MQNYFSSLFYFAYTKVINKSLEMIYLFIYFLNQITDILRAFQTLVCYRGVTVFPGECGFQSMTRCVSSPCRREEHAIGGKVRGQTGNIVNKSVK